jgi:hypothetical protein
LILSKRVLGCGRLSSCCESSQRCGGRPREGGYERQGRRRRRQAVFTSGHEESYERWHRHLCVLGAWLRLPLRDDAPCVALPCACGPGAHKQPSSDTEKDVACCLAHSRTGQRLALARMVPSGAAQQAAVIRSLCMQLPRHGDSMQTAARSTFTLIRSLGGLEAGDCLAVGAAALLLWLLPVEAGRRGAMGVAVHSSKTAPACMHAYHIIDIHTYGMRVCDHRATLCNAASQQQCVSRHTGWVGLRGASGVRTEPACQARCSLGYRRNCGWLHRIVLDVARELLHRGGAHTYSKASQPASQPAKTRHVMVTGGRGGPTPSVATQGRGMGAPPGQRVRRRRTVVVEVAQLLEQCRVAQQLPRLCPRWLGQRL